MAAVSQTLLDLARRVQAVPSPGRIWDVTEERMLRLHPSHPIPGPNLCAEIRTTPERVDSLVDEVRQRFRSAGLPCMWLLDEDTRPVDLAARLFHHGFRETVVTLCMVRPAGAPPIEADQRIVVEDALASLEAFRTAAAIQAVAFGDPPPGRDLRARFDEARAEAGGHLVMALVDGQAAGAGGAWVTPHGTVLRGGGVLPDFRGRGVYRALLAAREGLAIAAGAAGLATHARDDTSAPILARLGFRTVGTRRYLQDTRLTASGL